MTDPMPPVSSLRHLAAAGLNMTTASRVLLSRFELACAQRHAGLTTNSPSMTPHARRHTGPMNGISELQSAVDDRSRHSIRVVHLVGEKDRGHHLRLPAKPLESNGRRQRRRDGGNGPLCGRTALTPKEARESSGGVEFSLIRINRKGDESMPPPTASEATHTVTRTKLCPDRTRIERWPAVQADRLHAECAPTETSAALDGSCYRPQAKPWRPGAIARGDPSRSR
jgi:hypothetical protein